MAYLSVEEIAVDLIARQERLERQLKNASQLVDRSLGTMEARGKAFATRFSGFIAGFAVGAVVRELGQLADQSKQLDAQLKLATAGIGSFSKAQEDSRRIAAQTRNSLEATTKLYAGFLRASQETGRSQTEAARATQSFSEALKIGGAGAAEAASATLQFNQALQSGTLRGDEFNSIMEASPRVARLLADALGVPIGQLRAMAEQGKITSDVLFKALTDTRFTDKLDSEFRQLPQTFSEAMQSITDSAVITFGAFDKGGDFSNSIAHMLSEGTATFTGLEKLAQDFGIETRAVFEGLGDIFAPLLEGAQTVFGGVRHEANWTRDSIANIISGFDTVNNLLVDLGNRATSFDNGAKGILNRMIDNAGGKNNKHFEITPLTPRSDYAGQFLRGFNESVARSQKRLAAEEAAGTRVATPTKPTASSAAGATTKAKRSPLNPAVADREEEQLQDRILRAQADHATTAEESAKIELDRIENERQAFAEQVGKDKRMTASERQRVLALSDLAATADKAAVIRRRDIAVEERTSDAIRRENQSIEARNRDEQSLVRSRLDIATTAKQRLALELRLLQLAQEQEKADQEQLIADRKRILADPNASPDAKSRASSDIKDAQGRLSSMPERFANERQGVVDRNLGPLASYQKELQQNVGDINVALENVAVGGLQSLSDQIANVVTGTTSLKNAFKQMAVSIIADLARIAIQRALLNLLGGAGGGGGLFGGLFADGGQVKGFADGGSPGGRIAGPGTGRSDSIMALLGDGKKPIRVSNGEYIVNARATQQHLPLLEAINTGRLPGFADGGRIQASAVMPVPLSNVAARPSGGNTYNISVSADHSVTPAGFAADLAGQILAEARRMDTVAVVGANWMTKADLSRQARYRLGR